MISFCHPRCGHLFSRWLLVVLLLPTTFCKAALIGEGSLPYDNIHNSTNSEVILIYPLSGYYAGLQRALYWSIIAFTILGLGNVWLVTAAFGTAMTYSSVAAVHAVAIFAARSTEYYEADALAIWEILFCTSVLLPTWLAHYRRLRSTTAQIVLRLWGALMFIGGVIDAAQLVSINDMVAVQQNDCVANLPADVAAFSVVDWEQQNVCSSWQPYENATHPMRDVNEVVIAVQDIYWLGEWTDRLGVFAVAAGSVCIAFIAVSFLWPESKSLEKHRREQLKKLRKHKRAKGNHPADTIQMPAAWCIGIVTLAFSEATLHLVPVSEDPTAVGQWGPWVAVVFVLIAVLINHYFEEPIEDMNESLGKVLGPLVWYALDWRGKAPTPAERKRQEKAKTEAAKKAADVARRARMRTRETQTDDLEAAMPTDQERRNKSRRFSESDMNGQRGRTDLSLIPPKLIPLDV